MTTYWTRTLPYRIVSVLILNYNVFFLMKNVELRIRSCCGLLTDPGHDWLLLVPVDGDGRGVDPGGRAQVAQAHVRVLRHERVRPARQRRGVQLKQRGQVV